MSILQTDKVGQVALEFMLIAGLGIVMVLVLMIAVVGLSQANAESRTYDDVKDLGKAIQQELLLASELEDGYVRELDLPSKINGQEYNITLYTSTKYTYMIITYMSQETYYAVPFVSGEFTKGKTYLHKNNTLYLT